MMYLHVIITFSIFVYGFITYMIFLYVIIVFHIYKIPSIIVLHCPLLMKRWKFSGSKHKNGKVYIIYSIFSVAMVNVGNVFFKYKLPVSVLDIMDSNTSLLSFLVCIWESYKRGHIIIEDEMCFVQPSHYERETTQIVFGKAIILCTKYVRFKYGIYIFWFIVLFYVLINSIIL